MLDDTLVVFQSDNGGTSNPLFAGEGDASKVVIPCDNGPFREGKGSLYEGGTRVAAFATWRGRIRPGIRTGPMHVVDMYPTLARLAGARTDGGKPLDGLDVWEAVAQGRPSPRTEVVYNVEPFRAAVRQGDWKLIWRTPLPEAVELYNLAEDPSEKDNVADKHPDRVASLRARANELATGMAKPMLLEAEFRAMRERLSLPPALPEEPFVLGEP